MLKFASWLIVVATVLAAAAPVASASKPTDEPITDHPMIRSTLAVADRFWRAWGVELDPRAEVYRHDLSKGTRGWGLIGGVRSWLDVDVLSALWRGIPAERAEARIELCRIVVHERGHNAGLGHQDHGVMGGETPPRCKFWAIKWIAPAPIPRGLEI